VTDLSRGQIDPIATGCAFADEVLLPAIRDFGQLDQECPATSQPVHDRIRI
jgi:hypothetical protein